MFRQSRRHLVIAHRAMPRPGKPCHCPTWGLLNRLQRDRTLDDLMEWAWLFHKVQLKMLARGEHVAICELTTLRPGEGRVRKVMNEICLWADCTRLVLELSPSSYWGADLPRLTTFYQSLGFQINHEPRNPFMVQEDMIRYPVKGKGHANPT